MKTKGIRRRYQKDQGSQSLRWAGVLSWIGLLAGFAFLFISDLQGCGNSPTPPNSIQGQPSPALSSSPGPSRKTRPDIGFASRQKLIDHYQKHGREFGSIKLEEYLARAQQLRNRMVGDEVLEARRPDGVISRFNRKNGDFIAFNPNGVIRTYFRPTAGEAYFRRQAQR